VLRMRLLLKPRVVRLLLPRLQACALSSAHVAWQNGVWVKETDISEGGALRKRDATGRRRHCGTSGHFPLQVQTLYLLPVLLLGLRRRARRSSRCPAHTASVNATAGRAPSAPPRPFIVRCKARKTQSAGTRGGSAPTRAPQRGSLVRPLNQPDLLGLGDREAAHGHKLSRPAWTRRSPRARRHRPATRPVPVQ
jgi:hypothetical protein